MKKVLFMLSSMNIGGVEKSLLSLLSTMPKEKYDITILLLEKKGGFLSAIPDWIRVEEANWFMNIKPIIMQPPQLTIKGYLKDKQYIKALTFLFAYLFSKYLNNRYFFYHEVFKSVPKHPNKYDIAISYQGPTDSIDFYVANKVMAKKKISWIHFDVTKHSINKKLYEKLYKKFQRIFIVSKEGKEKLVEKIPSVTEKTEVFLNIISKKLIDEMSKKNIEFDANYTGIRLVTVGRLAHEKGQDIAIKVLSRLRKNGYEVRWYCIGEGRQRLKYEQLIEDLDLKDDFTLLGSRSNPYPFIRKSDIYIQTSRHEGYCLTLAEAKSLLKPIITTNFTGANEQIINGKTGLVVDIDEEQIFKALTELINNPKRRHEFSMNLSNEASREPIKYEKLKQLI